MLFKSRDISHASLATATNGADDVSLFISHAECLSCILQQYVAQCLVIDTGNEFHAFPIFVFGHSYSLPASSFPPNIMGSTPGFSHDSFQYNYPPEVPPFFVFQDTSNYQNLNEFNGDL